MRKNQSGFGAFAVLFLLIIIGFIGVTGWYVLHRQKTVQITGVADDTPKPGISVEDNVLPKTYTNTEYGFSFDYPGTWDLNQDLQQLGRGHEEGSVTVISRNGTKVHFEPNLGGKGGDCVDENGETSTTYCSTRTIMYVERLETSTVAKPIYFYKISLKDSDTQGAATTYFINIMSGNDFKAPTKTGSTVGAFINPYDEIEGTKVGYVTVYVDGPDDNIRDSKDYFDGLEVKEATPVLKSFKLLP